MYRRVFTNETVSNVISKDVNVFNAKKINLMAKVVFTTNTKSVFLLVQAISLNTDFAATYKTYELKPTEAASDAVLTLADVLDVEPVSAIRIKAINNDSVAATLTVDVETTEVIL